MRLLKLLVLHTALFTLGFVVAASCVRVDFGLIAFRCEPRQQDNCPEDYFCCSDDPSTLDGSTPTYGGGSGYPLFSGENNGRGTSGMCVAIDKLSGSLISEPEAYGCPLPCNPDNPGLGSAICGSSVCCQTTELSPLDCVQDSANAPWRPVSGLDIGRLTEWRPGSHETHQDANGTACTELWGQDTPERDACLRQLTVANQRGFCMKRDRCPLVNDPCEARNHCSMNQACASHGQSFNDPCRALLEVGGISPACPRPACQALANCCPFLTKESDRNVCVGDASAGSENNCEQTLAAFYEYQLCGAKGPQFPPMGATMMRPEEPPLAARWP